MPDTLSQDRQRILAQLHAIEAKLAEEPTDYNLKADLERKTRELHAIEFQLYQNLMHPNPEIKNDPKAGLIKRKKKTKVFDPFNL